MNIYNSALHAICDFCAKENDALKDGKTSPEYQRGYRDAMGAILHVVRDDLANGIEEMDKKAGSTLELIFDDDDTPLKL
jgi:hypothetical protein